jgi:hypothetical protein
VVDPKYITGLGVDNRAISAIFTLLLIKRSSVEDADVLLMLMKSGDSTAVML